jgi:transposase
MESLDLRTRIDLVKAYYSEGSSPIACLRKYKKDHQLHEHVCKESTVRRLIARFEETGSVSDLPRSGRPSVEEETVEKVAATMVHLQQSRASGSASAGEVARTLHLPASTVKKVLKTRLQWRPYRLHILQYLKETDFATRKQFSETILQHLSESSDYLANVLWSDEANFMLDGSVYTHQCVIWSPENPHAFVTKKLYPEHVTVWCGFTTKFVIGPYFFDGTVNAERYLTMLRDFVIPELKRHRALRKVTFQQDGASPHVAAAVKDFLSANFGTQKITVLFKRQSQDVYLKFLQHKSTNFRTIYKRIFLNFEKIPSIYTEEKAELEILHEYSY